MDVRRPEAYHLIVWKYFGLIPPKESDYKRSLYICFSIVIHSIFTFGFPLSMGIYLMNVANFKQFCENAFPVIVFVEESVKLLSVLFTIPTLKYVSETAERLHRRMNSEEELKCLQEAMREGYKVSITITILFNITMLVGEIFALVSIYVMPEPVLTFQGWFPIDWQANQTNFILCHSYQFIAIIVGGTLANASNTYMFLSIGNITDYTGHVNALSVRVQKLGGNRGKFGGTC